MSEYYIGVVMKTNNLITGDGVKFIKQVKRVDGKFYWAVHIPVVPTKSNPEIPVIGNAGDGFYLYAAPEIDSYVIKLVGAMPDPNMVKQNIKLGEA